MLRSVGWNSHSHPARRLIVQRMYSNEHGINIRVSQMPGRNGNVDKTIQYKYAESFFFACALHSCMPIPVGSTTTTKNIWKCWKYLLVICKLIFNERTALVCKPFSFIFLFLSLSLPRPLSVLCSRCMDACAQTHNQCSEFNQCI